MAGLVIVGDTTADSRTQGLAPAVQAGDAALAHLRATGLATRHVDHLVERWHAEGLSPGTDRVHGFRHQYAQARYLCYYLQEKGLLQKYYKEFVANQAKVSDRCGEAIRPYMYEPMAKNAT